MRHRASTYGAGCAVAHYTLSPGISQLACLVLSHLLGKDRDSLLAAELPVKQA
jgi:hypothetical protein